MMTFELRIVLSIAMVFYFVLILWMLKVKALELKYTLIWMVVGLVMAFMLAIPTMLKVVSNAIGIQSEMNGIYAFGIGFLLMICMMLTSIVSKQTSKITKIVQELSLLEKRIRDLEH